MSTHHHFALSAGTSPSDLQPALALAAALRKRFADCRITLCGPLGAWQQAQAAAQSCEYFNVKGLAARSTAWDAFRSLAAAWSGQRALAGFLRRQRVTLAIAHDGRSLGRAAAACRVPLVVLDYESQPSRATRALAPSAELVCVAWPEARQALADRAPVRVTGVPLRGGYGRQRQLDYRRSAARESRAAQRGMGRLRALPALRPPRLVVLGGGREGHLPNRVVPRALYKLGAKRQGWQIVHQSGRRDLDATRELYRKLAVSALVVPYIADLPRTLARADLAIARPGGAVLAELAACGVPGVLVPHAQADDDHQRANAERLALEGAALLADPRDVAGRFDDHLAGLLGELLTDPPRRRALADGMARRARPDAAWHVAEMIAEVVSSSPAMRAG